MAAFCGMVHRRRAAARGGARQCWHRVHTSSIARQAVAPGGAVVATTTGLLAAAAWRVVKHVPTYWVLSISYSLCGRASHLQCVSRATHHAACR